MTTTTHHASPSCDVFYNTTANLIIDLVDPVTGRGKFCGQNAAELAASYAPAAIATMPLDEARAAEGAARITAAEPITAEQFDYFLNVLPPVDWVRRSGIEHFFLSERICGDIVAYAVRIGDRHWKFQDHARLSTAEIAQRVAAAQTATA